MGADAIAASRTRAILLLAGLAPLQLTVSKSPYHRALKTDTARRSKSMTSNCKTQCYSGGCWRLQTLNKGGYRSVSLESVMAGLLLLETPEIVAVLYAYFDETGLHRESPYTIVSGIVGSLPAWVGMQAMWTKRLAEDQIAAFHATDCRGGHNGFLKYKSDERRRNTLWRDLAGYVSGHAFVPVSSMVNKEYFDEIDDAVFRERFPSPYSLASEDCLGQLEEIGTLSGEIVTALFAEHQQYGKRLSVVADVYKRSRSHAPHIGSILFCRPNYVVPLQAADMLCYETLHDQSRTGRVEDWRYITWNLTRGKRPLGRYWDRGNLKGLVAQHPTAMIC